MISKCKRLFLNVPVCRLILILFLSRQTGEYVTKHKERLQSVSNTGSDPSLLGDMISNPNLTIDDIQRTLLDVLAGGIDSASNRFHCHPD